MATKSYQSFEDYIEDQPEHIQVALNQLTEYVLRAVPSAEKLINYNIPAIALKAGGKRDQQVMIAGYKRHIGFYPHPTTIEKFEEELKTYKHSKGSVQFPVNLPLPEKLIIEMVRYRKKILDSIG